MQICRLKNCRKIAVAVVAAVFSNSLIFSSDIDMPSMPEMPSMPSISLDGSFYTPSVPTTMMGPNRNNKKKSVDSEETVIKSGDDAELTFEALLKNDSTLTAGDISTLYDYGLFTDLTSLTSTIGGGILGGSDYNTGNPTNILLQEILNQLNDLKKEQKKATPEEQVKLENNQKDSANFKQRNPSVLRFRINDYDIKDSLVEVFLSEPEDDGTFLLTGDRRYVANNKSRTETFYLLFKAKKDSGAAVSYNVQPSIVQDYENKNSFVYKMAQIKDLTADKTGNLVVLRYNDNNLNVDLLLDIDKR